MLIENKELSENDVISMKLANGEEVVARFIRMTADMVTIKKPLGLVITQQGIAMVPFMISLSDDMTLTIDRRTIMAHVKARKEVADAYTQQTSNIMTASTMPPASNKIV